jgi:hypothetical protein
MAVTGEDVVAGPRIGVLLLRVEHQSGRLQATLTSTLDVSAGGEEIQTVVGAGEAILAVGRFLDAFSMRPR